VSLKCACAAGWTHFFNFSQCLSLSAAAAVDVVVVVDCTNCFDQKTVKIAGEFAAKKKVGC
jgi:hypothetical protein